MITAQTQAVLFDMDGTLIHTAHVWDELLARLIGQNNIVLFRNVRREIPGSGMVQNAETLRVHFNISISAQELETWYSHKFEELIKKNPLQFIDGFEEFHASVVRRTITPALVTNCPRFIVDIIDSQLKLCDYFGANIISSTDINSTKPAPDLYLHALKQLSVNPQDCIVFEDSFEGITAAHQAGITNIIGLQHDNNKEQLNTAAHIIQNYNDVLLYS